MKKIILSAAVAALFVSCADKNAYTVNCTLPGEVEDSTLVYLYINNEVADSTYTAAGAFSFKGSIEQPANATIMTKAKAKSRFRTSFIAEPGVITIGGEALNDLNASGTPLNEAMGVFNQTMADAYKGYTDCLAQLPADVTPEQKRELLSPAIDAYYAAMEKANYDLFDANKDNVLGANALYSIGSGDSNAFDSLYVLASDVVKNNPRIVKLKKTVDALNATQPGCHFVDFAVANGDTKGGEVKFSDFVGKGKFILVDFWASWCGPCRGEIPFIRDTYEKFHGDQFDIVGVAVDDKEADTAKAIDELGILWNVIYNADWQATAGLYGVNGIPQIILIGPDGTILERNLRGEAIAQKVGEHLNK